MNLDNDDEICSGKMTLLEFKNNLDDFLEFIGQASGSTLYTMNETELYDNSNITFDISSKNDGGDAKALIHIGVSFDVTLIITECIATFSQSNEMKITLKTKSQLADLLCLTLCPSLCLIRSLMHIIETIRLANGNGNVPISLNIKDGDQNVKSGDQQIEGGNQNTKIFEVNNIFNKNVVCLKMDSTGDGFIATLRDSNNLPIIKQEEKIPLNCLNKDNFEQGEYMLHPSIQEAVSKIIEMLEFNQMDFARPGESVGREDKRVRSTNNIPSVKPHTTSKKINQRH